MTRIEQKPKENLKKISNHFYKYREFNNNNRHFVEEILVQSNIYFAPPADLNDPLDSIVPFSYNHPPEMWRDYLRPLSERYWPHLNETQRFSEIEKIIKEKKYIGLKLDSYRDHMGVFSMSSDRASMPMWANYAGNYTGLCIEFSSSNSLFCIAFRMDYEDIEEPIPYLSTSKDEKMRLTLLTKRKSWLREKEWRLIDYSRGAGICSFPEEALTGVIFGHKMTEEDKRTIIEWSQYRKYPPKLYETKIDKINCKLIIEETDY